MKHKSLITNLIAGLVFVVFYFSPEFTGRFALTQAGLFAFSGAITNWLAVYMLFEKVPGLYGSGIIPTRFEEFKKGIRALIIDNFFTQNQFSKFKERTSKMQIDPTKLEDLIDFDVLFDDFLKMVSESPLGMILAMVGGIQALEPLREPFKTQFTKKIPELISKVDLSQLLGSTGVMDKFLPKIETMIDSKLEDLTPQIVKEIVAKMIRTHLGWLVVWGGVFGGVIGLSTAIII